mmetsp:Transcript_59108/g.132404  ORF Transcript_59108/g.132404 Transcript_59108/m.132404 type:complete len:418 (-) Transcript_59108:90-1343(-)
MADSSTEDRRPPTEGVILVGALAAMSSVSCAWLLTVRRRHLRAVRCRLFPRQFLYIVTAGLIMHLNVLAMAALELLDNSMACTWEWISCCGFANMGFHIGRNALILAETHLAGSFLLQACGCNRKSLLTKLLPAAAGIGLVLAVLPVLPVRATANEVEFCPEALHFDAVTFGLLLLCISVGFSSLVVSAVKAVLDAVQKKTFLEERFSGRWRRASCYLLIFLITFGPTLAGFLEPWSSTAILTKGRYIELDYGFQSLNGFLNAWAYVLQRRHANRLLWELLQQEQTGSGGVTWPAQALAEQAAARRSMCPGLTFEDEDCAASGEEGRQSEVRLQGSSPDVEAKQSDVSEKKRRRGLTRFLVGTDGTDGVDIVEIADIFDEASMRADMELELLDFSRNPEIQRELHASVSQKEAIQQS